MQTVVVLLGAALLLLLSGCYGHYPGSYRHYSSDYYYPSYSYVHYGLSYGHHDHHLSLIKGGYVFRNSGLKNFIRPLYIHRGVELQNVSRLLLPELLLQQFPHAPDLFSLGPGDLGILQIQLT
jgi:hypothetical protein